MSENNPKMTMFANQAMIVATAVAGKFASKEFGVEVKRKLRIDEPEGMSTDGGRKARQPLTLVPISGQAPALVAGWLDVALSEAELRPYGVIANKYQARYGMPPDITKEDYTRFLSELYQTLKSLGLKSINNLPDEPLTAVVPLKVVAAPAPPRTTNSGRSNAALPVMSANKPAAKDNKQTLMIVGAVAAVLAGLVILLLAL